MLRFHDIYKRFGHLEVLRNISVEFEAGKGIALLGPNGCGKTTLIKCILGMVLPDTGDITFQGKSILNDYLYRAQIGYMPQIGRYPENMKVGQVIETILSIRNHLGERDNSLYHDFKIDQIAHKYMGNLSGGTRQKVSAVLAFMFNPLVLILDEPTAGLDPISSSILKEKVQESIEAGKLVLITSHLLGELDEIVSSVIYMEEGSIRFRHTLQELYELSGKTRLGLAVPEILKSTRYVSNS
jgi:Cu-processing system ATP-binding protein